MSDRIKVLIAQIKTLEDELEDEFRQRRDTLNIRIDKGRAVFDEKTRRRHDELRTKLRGYVGRASPLVVLTAPFIYAIVIPFLLLDVFVSIYQMICFPVYGIKKVQRGDHIVFDRHRLMYLNGIEKLNCTYCAYGNGILSYASEIASRTEEYWCPIKHAKRLATPHRHYPHFVEYGDAEGYRERVEQLKAHSEPIE